MNRLRAVLDGGPPAVAVSFRNSGDREPAALVRQAIGAGIDIAELRIDRFPAAAPAAVLDYVAHFRELPTIATIRSVTEGGEWSLSEPERLDLFRAVIPEVDGVDIELSARDIAPTVIESAKSAGKVVVVSSHNFDTTPGDTALDDLVSEARGLGADYVKISTMARTAADVQTLAALLLRHRSTPLIVIAMGAAGTVSRIFFPALGSRLTFSFLGGAFAPGQLDFQETAHLLRKFYPDYDTKKVVDLEHAAG